MPMILSVHLCFSVSAGARSRAKTLLMLWLSSLVAMAHVGSPNVFYEGEAGPYPVRVIIRPPGVVPGLAEIHVRILAGEAGQVSVLPVHWEVGTKGAPPADQAKLVSGETNLFSAELWLMDFGAYSVFVNVEGAKGRGASRCTAELCRHPTFDDVPVVWLWFARRRDLAVSFVAHNCWRSRP